MTKKNLLLALCVTLFWGILISLFLIVKGGGDEEFDEYQSEYEDSLLFDANLDGQIEYYDLEPNQIFVSCDTVVRYWENINTEEQQTSLDITCDTIFLYCDTVIQNQNVTTICDTLYYTNN
jgi:hypothetical protein